MTLTPLTAKEAIDTLESYPWPGNVRQLQNVIERAVILGAGPVLDTEALGLSDDTNAEVLAGLKAGDTIATHKTDFSLSDGESNVNNPFMPFRKRTSKTKKHK